MVDRAATVTRLSFLSPERWSKATAAIAHNFRRFSAFSQSLSTRRWRASMLW
jgi:hypothetical protein